MSELLAFDSFMITLGASMEDIKTSMLAGLTNRGYQVVGNGIAYDSVTGSFSNPQKVFEGGLASVGQVYAAVGTNVTLKLTQAEEITKYRFMCGTQYEDRTPAGWTLHYSDDGSVFTLADTQTGERLCGGEDREYVLATAPGAHKYWKWTFTAARGATHIDIPHIVPFTSTGKFVCKDPTLVLAPPATEAVGNAYQREVVAFIITGTTLAICPGVQYLQDTPPVVGFNNAQAGAKVASVTFDGVTVSIPTPATAATANDNLWALFKALKESSLNEFKEWEWFYQPAPAQQATDTTDWVIGYRKSYAPASQGGTTVSTSFTATNVTLTQLGMPAKAATTPCWVPPASWATAGFDLTIDLVSGFIYYMQVNSRGFAIATKTNAGFYGPIHACWGDHETALKGTPESPIPFMTMPIELMVGFDAAATDASASATVATATFYAMGRFAENVSVYRGRGAFDTNGIGHPMGGGAIRAAFTNFHNAAGAPKKSGTFALFLSGLTNSSAAQTIIDDFQVHSMRDAGIKAVSVYGGSSAQYGFVPFINTEDWFRFRGSASNETLMLAADQVQAGTLQNAHSATDAPTYLQFDSVDAFKSVGFVVIGSEVYGYTGKDAGTKRLTGISRAQYTSKARDHWSGEKVYQAQWFTIINGGALFCGYVKPV